MIEGKSSVSLYFRYPVYEVQENAPEMTLLSGMVRGQADFSQQPYGLTACAGVRHDQYAHSRSCAHCAAHCCQVLQRREENIHYCMLI